MMLLGLVVSLCCGAASASSCPAEFPFPVQVPGILFGNICYNTDAAAASGNGPCGSWCTHDISVGSNCGDNSHRVCAPTPTPSPTNPPSCALFFDDFSGGDTVPGDWPDSVPDGWVPRPRRDVLGCPDAPAMYVVGGVQRVRFWR